MAGFVEYQQLQAGAETACGELIAGIRGKVTGDERVAVACALARAAAQFQEDALVEYWLADGTISPRGAILSHGYFYRLAALTGLSEAALERRFRKAVHAAAAADPRPQ